MTRLVLELIASAGAGAVLGVLHFGGLWLTIGRLAESRHPASLVLASSLVRLAVVVAGLGALAGAHWSWLAAGLVGFVAVRRFLVRKWGIPANGAHAGA